MHMHFKFAQKIGTLLTQIVTFTTMVSQKRVHATKNKLDLYKTQGLHYIVHFSCTS